jgi:hypothetical protein
MELEAHTSRQSFSEQAPGVLQDFAAKVTGPCGFLWIAGACRVDRASARPRAALAPFLELPSSGP